MTTNSAAVVIGDCSLYLGDCRDVLPEIGLSGPVITDPPYDAEAHTKGRRMRGKQRNGSRTVEYAALEFEQLQDGEKEEYSKLFASVGNGWVLAFCQAEAVGEWRLAFEEAEIAYKRAMVWVKPDGAPQFTGDRPGMGYESIVAGWRGTGRSSWNGGGRHGVFTVPQRNDNNPKSHQTEKPIRLMNMLISLFSNDGETVIDPFMGSGTTGVACVNLGRKFVGVERNEEYFEIACKRIEAAHSQLRLFA
jgi:site-specific DNA-methyltransferase (adenine-specific)